ncbi:hypothetical protein P3T76_000774 [Phytophthora citrophthora]|uniref:Uncharacterized protein n=1 Tax=Phytophthora citrophthora TaxID=4793 RepID=A0AAD9LSN5_9STRA|nr:hypothetical protein P3T76_000774 [Phytophthora citrophthora]
MSFPSLPLPLISLILEFSFYCIREDLMPISRHISETYGADLLKNAALVCRSWYKSIDEVVARYRRDTLQLTFKFGTRVEVLAIRRLVQQRGRCVRDLRIRMGRSDGTRFLSGVWWWMEDREIPWDAIFSHLPGLKRLDLRYMPLESRHLPVLLEMAAKYCLQVEMLLLPKKQEMNMMVNCAAIERVVKVVRKAMQRWYLKGKCGGLKQLTMPTREEENRFQTSTKFIEDVIEFCPNVEYLDGYRYAVDDLNDVSCDEEWMISLETWILFNKTCKNLRDFYWVVVPFADPFFRVFGEHIKPNLKKLKLTSNLTWDYEHYFKQDGSAGLLTEKPGYGLLATDVAALFKGCPALIDLEITYDQQKNEEALPTLLDAALFGDKFWEAVVESCPKLQTLYTRDCSAYGGSRTVRPIHTFTDHGLLTLAKHSHLSSIELSAVCCSSDGILKYLQHIFKATDFAGGNRSLVVSLAGTIEHDPTQSHPFYQELVDLLKHIIDASEEELDTSVCEPSVSVFNPHSSSVDYEWSVSYMHDELKPLLEKAIDAHPKLGIHVVVCRDDDESFRRIDNVEFNWCSGGQEGDMFIEDEYLESDIEGSDEDDFFFDDDYEIVPADEVDDEEA